MAQTFLELSGVKFSLSTVDLADDDESFAFAIDRHRKPYFGRSASKRSRVAVGSISPWLEERLGRSGGIVVRARGLFIDDDAMVDESYDNFLMERFI